MPADQLVVVARRRRQASGPNTEETLRTACHTHSSRWFQESTRSDPPYSGSEIGVEVSGGLRLPLRMRPIVYAAGSTTTASIRAAWCYRARVTVAKRDCRPTMTRYRIAVIPGDGIGKEVVPEGIRVLESAAAGSESTSSGLISTGAARPTTPPAA